MENEKVKTINSVKGLRIGDVFYVCGINYIAEYFPTRCTVYGVRIRWKQGEPSTIKASIGHTRAMFWHHYKTGDLVYPTNPLDGYELHMRHTD